MDAGWCRRIIGFDKREEFILHEFLSWQLQKTLFTFALLNGSNPDVQTIYFVSIENKKELVTEITRYVLVIMKDALICAANKQLGKLVNIYVMFLQKIRTDNRKEKKKKRLPFLQLQTLLSVLQLAYTSALLQYCTGISLSVGPVDLQ